MLQGNMLSLPLFVTSFVRVAAKRRTEIRSLASTRATLRELQQVSLELRLRAHAHICMFCSGNGVGPARGSAAHAPRMGHSDAASARLPSSNGAHSSSHGVHSSCLQKH